MKEHNYNTHNAIIVIITIFIFLSILSYNVFFIHPKIEKKINNIQHEFNDLKSYLNKKIPELDSATNINKKNYIDLKNIYNDIQKINE